MLFQSASEPMRWNLRRVLGLLLLGIVLLCCILPSQTMSLPLFLEPISRAAYRATYLLIVPARFIAAIPFPVVYHHWPRGNFILSCLITPYIYAGVYYLGKWVLACLFRNRPRAIGAKHDAPQVARREFLTRTSTIAAGVAVAGVGGYASYWEPSALYTRYYDMQVKGLPPQLDGLRIAHVSDTHYGPFISAAFLLHVAEYVNALSPDLVALTGDYVHMTPRAIRTGVEALGQFHGRLGVAAVLGNHDHWEGAQACRTQFARIGVPLLDNTRLFLSAVGLSTDIPFEPAICIGGVGDYWTDHISFESALEGVPADMPRIMLSHNPDTAEQDLWRYRIAFMLSGHTHGGQVLLPGYGPVGHVSQYGLKYMGGLCQGPHFPVIVSRGVGMAFMPVRLGVHPEVGLVTLHKI